MQGVSRGRCSLRSPVNLRFSARLAKRRRCQLVGDESERKTVLTRNLRSACWIIVHQHLQIHLASVTYPCE